MSLIDMIKSKDETIQNQLSKGLEESRDRAKDFGKFGDFWKTDLPYKTEKLKEGEYAIDLIPFFVGDNYPTQKTSKKKGDIAHVTPLWIHRGVGVNEEIVICPAKNYGLKCPICMDEAQISRRDPDSDVLKQIKAVRRALYLGVNRMGSGEPELKVFDTPHNYTESSFASRARRPLGGGYIYYASPDVNGKTLYFRVVGKGIRMEIKDHDFINREGPIEDKFLDHDFVMDDFFKIYSFDELKSMYFALDVYSDSSDAKRMDPSKQETPSPPSDEHKKKDSVIKEMKCPAGGVLGENTDDFPECSDCPHWEVCARTFQEREAANMNAAETKPDDDDDIPF